MTHWIDPKIDVILFEGQNITFVVNCGKPVTMGEHGTFGFTSSPRGVLKLAEIIKTGRFWEKYRRGSEFLDIFRDIDGDTEIFCCGCTIGIGDEDMCSGIFNHVG